MIKRPLLWGITAFIGGILSAWYKAPIIYIAIVALATWITIYLLMFRIKRYINRKDFILWGLPILMLIGFLAMGDKMKPPDIDKEFEEKSDCDLTGKITMIVRKSWGTAYFLKDVRITLPNEHRYMVEGIIVNTYIQNHIQKQEYQYNQVIQLNQSQDQSQNQFQDRSKQDKEYRIGNIINVSGTIKKFSSNTNPGGFNEELYYKSQNISYKVSADNIILVDGSYSKYHFALNTLKEELIRSYTTILPEKEAGTLMAMVLGDKYLLEDEIRLLYQKNGISHILAISGLHVSMLGAAIYFLLRRLRLGLIASTVLSLAFVYSYGILTNFSVSTNRAVVMYSILLISKIIGKTFDILSALSLSAFLILLQNPMVLFQAGFLLSFGAVLGIAIILPSLNLLYEAKSTLLKSVYVSVSAQILTLPIVLYYFFQIPLYSVAINLIILPLTSLLMLTSLIAGVVGMVSLSLGVFIGGTSNYILIFYEQVCRFGSKLPGNLITVGRPDTVKILIYIVGLSIFLICAKKVKTKRIKTKGILLLSLIIVMIVLLIIPKARKGLTVAMLDVGQGEAIIIENDTGSTYFIDGGSSDINQVGRYRITPYLLYRGIDELDYAIVTHTDIDHVSGLIELIVGQQISIKHLILPNTTLKNEAYSMLEEMARDYDIKLLYTSRGDLIRDGELSIATLHPSVGYQPSSNNDYSTVLSVSYGEFDMLITGDIEEKGEKELNEFLLFNKSQNKGPDNSLHIINTDYDVLQVAHHGSKYSTSEEILSIIRPKVSLISCGKNNRYGHPHEELLDRLGDVGSEVVKTYESGAITIKTDGKRMRIDEFIKDME